MFTLTRRTLTGLAAVAALAIIGAAATAPERADAAPVCRWQMPEDFEIKQSNGWKVTTRYQTSPLTWAVFMRPPNNNDVSALVRGTMKLTAFANGPTSALRFTITWKNGSAGIYTGTIDNDGFVTGTTRDKFTPRSQAGLYFLEPFDCD